MNKKQVVEQVLAVAEDIADKHGVVLFDVEFGKQDGYYVLSVYIDKPGGVTLDDCEKVHVELNSALDDLDPIPHSYFLQVSSPGLDRPIKTENALKHSIGKQIRLKTYVSFAGQKRFAGRLQEVTPETVIIGTDKGSVEIPRDKIASIRLSSEM